MRNVVTGNLLKFFGTLNMPVVKLIQFTTIDGKVRKGALISESASLKLSAEFKTAVPLSMCLPVLDNFKANMTSSTIKLNAPDFSVERYINKYTNPQENFVLIVPLAKDRGGDVYLDKFLLGMIKGNNFSKSGISMRGYIEKENVQQVLDYLGQRFGLNAMLTAAQFKTVAHLFDKTNIKKDESEVFVAQKREEVPTPEPQKPTSIDYLKLRAKAMEMEIMIEIEILKMRKK
jgi:hypothetical protein